MNEISVPVLIVGAGPAGLATSLLLSRYGVAHMLIEKYSGTAHTPRAHIVNQRTVEIFRHMGIEDRLLAVGTPQHLMSNNVWSTSLVGLEVARLQTWGTSPDRAADYRKASPSPMTNCPQTVLEPLLVAAIIEAGVCDLRFNHEFLELRQDDSGVTATIRDRSAGQDLTVRSQYLVGADGGRSQVLNQAGLTVEGETGLAEAANIDHDGVVARDGKIAQHEAELPGIVTVKAGEPKLGLLLDDAGEVVGWSHRRVPSFDL